MRALAEEDGIAEAAKDYVAGMTDRFALSIYQELFMPKRWKQKIL